MFRNCRIWLILLPVLLFILPWTATYGTTAAGDDATILKLKSRILQNPADNDTRLKLAGIYYELAGFQHHFTVKTLLWTEPLYKRAGFTNKLPQILPQPSTACQQLLLHILDRDGNNRSALVMAGNYHLYMNQKEIGLWYLRRVWERNPDSIEINLDLADYYLDEWLPAQVLKLLDRHNSPEACLRKGAALIQSGEYQLALGYLLKADPLPPLWEITRDLNLLKVYLILRDYQNFDSLIQMMQRRNEVDSAPIIAATLLKELQVWKAFWSGDSWQAQIFWNQGGKLFPEYYWWRVRWNLNSTHFASVTTPAGSLATFKDNNFIQAARQILRGREHVRNGDPDSATQSFAAAIKSDPSSVIGLLEAGNLQLKSNNYVQALEFYNQALKVNPKFIPILKKRAEIYQNSGNLVEAGRDREMIKLFSIAGVNEGAKLQFVPVGKEKTGIAVAVRGDTRYLTGIWFSPDGETWEWLPWWGGFLYIHSGIRQCWLVPAGKGLEGEACFIENLSSDLPRYTVKQPRIEIDFESEGPGPETLKSEVKNNQNQDIVNQDGELPRLSFILTDTPGPGKIRVRWRVDQPVSSYLEVLSNQGVWEQIPATADSSGVFSGLFPDKNVVFCRIVLKNQWGKLMGVYPVTELNRRLADNLPGWLVSNAVSGFVNRRNIEIQSVSTAKTVKDDNWQIQWAFSNDLAIWSPWKQGSAPVQWRLNSGDGLKLVYVRYKSLGGTEDYKVGVITVSMDTCWPELLSSDVTEINESLQRKLLFRLKFDEPVILKTLVHQSETLSKTVNRGPVNYLPEIAAEIEIPKSQKSLDILDLTVADQAGNQSNYVFEVSPTGISRKQ